MIHIEKKMTAIIKNGLKTTCHQICIPTADLRNPFLFRGLSKMETHMKGKIRPF